MRQSNSTSSSLRRLLNELKAHRGDFALAFVAMLIFSASDGGVPFLIRKLLNDIFANNDKALLNLMPFLLLGFSLVRAGADLSQQYLLAKTGQSIAGNLRRVLNEKILALSPRFFIRKSSAEVLSSMTSDINLMRGFYVEACAPIIRDTVRIIVLIATAVYMDPKLAAIAFIAVPIAVLPVLKFGRKNRRLSRQGQDVTGTLSARLQESILGHRVVKAYCGEELERERFKSSNDELTKTLTKTEWVKALSGPVNEVLASLAIGGVMIYGGYAVLSGERSAGDFVAFLVAIFLLYEPFKKLSKVYSSLQASLAAADRYYEIIDTKNEVDSVSSLNITGQPLLQNTTVTLRGVTVHYDNDPAPALKDVTLTIPQGQSLAIVGPSGAGKSTLADLLPRFVDNYQGEIAIGGVDIRAVDIQTLRRQIAIVSQHTFLFNDTIEFNIRYGNLDASREEIRAAAEQANALDFIERFPAGMDTVVGEQGYALSGGQRQRIAIARAILKNAPILILDEATSALDSESERAVQAALVRLMQGRTTIVIAHRLSTVKDVDQVIVLRSGKIVEEGRYANLVAAGGEFARLHHMQSLSGDYA